MLPVVPALLVITVPTMRWDHPCPVIQVNMQMVQLTKPVQYVKQGTGARMQVAALYHVRMGRTVQDRVLIV